MSVTLESLELSTKELEFCKDAVRKMAYFNWLDAGCPDCDQLEFWLKAEREWIERNYVPQRTLDGNRPQSNDRPSAAFTGENPCEPRPAKSRVPGRAKAKVQ